MVPNCIPGGRMGAPPCFAQDGAKAPVSPLLLKHLPPVSIDVLVRLAHEGLDRRLPAGLDAGVAGDIEIGPPCLFMSGLAMAEVVMLGMQVKG